MAGVRRLSRPQRKILKHLEGAESDYGLAIADSLELWTATVYPALRRLEESGLVTSELEDAQASDLGRPLRRLYRLTDEGAGIAHDVDPLPVAHHRSRLRRGWI